VVSKQEKRVEKTILSVLVAHRSWSKVRNISEKILHLKFSGFDYFVIPKAVISDEHDEAEFIETLEEFEKNTNFPPKNPQSKTCLAVKKIFWR